MDIYKFLNKYVLKIVSVVIFGSACMLFLHKRLRFSSIGF